MIEIKYHIHGEPHIEHKAAKFFDVNIFDGIDKCIRFHFFRRDNERDWWILYPYKKYADEDQLDYIKIDGKLYTGDELYRLARGILLKKETEALDILEG